ncbi:MAG: glutathione S-transferase family protein [Hyphomonadaceae bacterium]|nr:glutathione S-transferase family protein [Hyphomonadaceae bacterium]
MKLYCHPLSPFARKAMILARKKGLSDKIEEICPEKDGANGYANSSNPLGKIPALEREGHITLFDSPVICEYLDTISGDPWLPSAGEERARQQRLHALGDGISVATYNYRYETVRPDALHWDEMIARHTRSLESAVDALEAEVDDLGKPWEYGNLSILCGLAYMGFRAPHINWKSRAPKLASWAEDFESDPVFQETNVYDE